MHLLGILGQKSIRYVILDNKVNNIVISRKTLLVIFGIPLYARIVICEFVPEGYKVLTL